MIEYPYDCIFCGTEIASREDGVKHSKRCESICHPVRVKWFERGNGSPNIDLESKWL